jgi:hypothetical protein
MIHIQPRYIPFALALLPFLGVGIGIPPTVQDWSRGHLMRGDAISLAIGFAIVVAWYWAILRSIKTKRQQGKETLLGLELSSWLWSPPVTFSVGFICGLSLVLTGQL